MLPASAFKSTTALTLLALDGNPMATMPEEAFTHLNGSLRGLSLGGRFLTCDCKMRWVAHWIRDFDLQVTSRERNPQFCGNPQRLRDRNFYQLSPNGKNGSFSRIFKKIWPWKIIFTRKIRETPILSLFTLWVFFTRERNEIMEKIIFGGLGNYHIMLIITNL